MTVSIRRKSAGGPSVSRIATSAPIGSARYSDGNNDADTSASTCRWPAVHATIEAADTATTWTISTMASGVGWRAPADGPRPNAARVTSEPRHGSHMGT